MINIKFFASFREQLGLDNYLIEVDAPITVNELINELQNRDEKFSLLSEGNVLVAKNQEITGLDATLKSEDEVAFFPPVTGG